MANPDRDFRWVVLVDLSWGEAFEYLASICIGIESNRQNEEWKENQSSNSGKYQH